MAGTSCVVVLCPNGRRATVKVTPNTSLLKVLEEACLKYNLNSADYELRHYKRVLDLGLPIRFSNLCNNAEIEMRPAQNARTESTVKVCIQIESGERFTKDLPPSTTVYDMLLQCVGSDSTDSQNKGEPICIYMRQKIDGDSLKSTTLRSLGLTQGQAIFRLLYRKPEDMQDQAHVSKPMVAPLAPPQQPPTRQIPPRKEEISMPSAAKIPRMDTASPEMITAEPESSLETITAEPESSSEMLVDGQTSSSDMLVDEPSSSEMMVDVQTTSSSEMIVDENELSTEKKIDVKESSVQYFGSAAKVKEDSKNCENTTDAEYEEKSFNPDDIKYVGPRHSVLYSLDDITEIKRADVPAEFYEITANDVRYMYDQLRKERAELENIPLLTAEQRQNRISQMCAGYEETVIRIYFPERIVLQAVFSLTETVQTVLDFAKEFTENNSLPYYLYLTPPKQKLNPSLTLLQSFLVPAANIHLGCDVQCPRFLSTNYRDKLSDPRAATWAATNSRKKGHPMDPLPQTGVKFSSESVSNNTVQSQSSSSQSPRVNKSEENVPKWLKLGKR